MWRVRRAPAGAAVVLAGALAACSGDSPGGGAGAAERPLKVVGQFEVHSLDPATSNGFFTLLQVAETLVATDAEGRLRPGLASSWQPSPDRRSWRFTLRPKALFHDGKPVTGGAVAAALEVARSKEGGPLASAPITAIKAVDDTAVTVRLSEPFAPLPAVLAHTSTQVLAPASYGPDGAVREVIGSGPYRVQRVQPPQSIEVAAFDRWSGQRPAVAEVTYLAVGRSESRALMAGSGEADVTFGLDPVSLQGMQQSSTAKIISVTAPRTILLKVNAGSPMLSDVRVRQALSLALDRRAMAAALLREPELAATQLFPPSLPQWHQPDLPPLVHDVAQARQLLAQAGWRPGADGVLVKDGRPFRISLRTFPDRPELPPLATAIQAALKDVGIALDVRVGNSGEIPAAHQDGSLELALYARNFSLVPDPLATLLEDLAPGGADWGAMNWDNPQLTLLLRTLAAGPAEADAGTARQEVARILQDELPLIPLAWYRQSAAVAAGLEGLTLDPLERSWGLAEVSRAR